MCSYDYKREYQLGLETTILVKNYTVSNLWKIFLEFKLTMFRPISNHL